MTSPPMPNGELVPQGGGDSIPLSRSPLTLGRRESCDICLQFPNVSGKHCELIFKEGHWILHDLESTNGIKVNGHRIEKGAKKLLQNDDLLTIGKRSFAIQYVESGKASDLEEFEDKAADIFSTPLLEKANLAHPPRYGKKPKRDLKNPALPSEIDEEEEN